MYITEQDLLRKNNNFDVLRHTAALLVFATHVYNIFGVGNNELLKLLTGKRYVFSYFGLAIFFSMSGFLVCRSLVTAGSVKQYLLNRFLRIWPAFFVCILFCIFIVGLPFTTLSAARFLGHPQTISFFFINTSLASCRFFLPGMLGVNGNYSVNGSIWTIPVEVRLYVLLLMFYLATRLRFRQWLPIVAITIWITWIVIPAKIQSSLLPRHLLDSINLGLYFLAGACFYLYKEKIALKLYIWVILLVYWLSLHLWFPSIVHYAEHPFLVYSFMWIAFRWYKIPFIKADISYGFYLYGTPALLIIQQLWGQYLNLISYFLIAGCCAVLLALLSWYFIEKKALSFKKTFKKKPVPSSM